MAAAQAPSYWGWCAQQAQWIPQPALSSRKFASLTVSRSVLFGQAPTDSFPRDAGAFGEAEQFSAI